MGMSVCDQGSWSVCWLARWYLITRRTRFAIHIDRNLVVFLIGQIVGHAGKIHRDGKHVVRKEAVDRVTSYFSILEGIVETRCWLGLG